jgi:hypothetical protein
MSRMPSRRFVRPLRWLVLAATGCMLFQANTAQCDLTLQALQTALLGGIAGGMYFLARNV